jgi:peptidoglycan hydrolase CwlO-like protein
MPDYKEALGKIVDELEENLKEEQIKNNRLEQEIKILRNKYAQLVDVIAEGGEICRQLKM